MESKITQAIKQYEPQIKQSNENERKKAIEGLTVFSKEIKEESDKILFLNKLEETYKKVCTAVYMKIVIGKIVNALDNSYVTKNIADVVVEPFSKHFFTETNDELKNLMFSFVSKYFKFQDQLDKKMLDFIKTLDKMKEPLKTIVIQNIPEVLDLPNTTRIQQLPLCPFFVTLLNSVKSPKNTPLTTIVAFRYLFSYFRIEGCEKISITEVELSQKLEKALEVYCHPEFINLIKDTPFLDELYHLVYEITQVSCIANFEACESNIMKILSVVLNKDNLLEYTSKTSTKVVTTMLIKYIYSIVMKEDDTEKSAHLIIHNLHKVLDSFMSGIIDDNDIPNVFIISAVNPQKRREFNKCVFKIVKPKSKTYEVVKQFFIANFEQIFRKVFDILEENPESRIGLRALKLLVKFTNTCEDSYAKYYFDELKKFTTFDEVKAKKLMKLMTLIIKKNVNVFKQYFNEIVSFACELDKIYKAEAIEFIMSISKSVDDVLLEDCEKIGLVNYELYKNEEDDGILALVKSVFAKLTELEENTKFSVATFKFVFPLMDWLVNQNEKSTEFVKPQNQMMKILNYHCSIISDKYPLVPLVHCLFKIIMTLPRFIQKVLICLSQIIRVSNEETITIFFNNLLDEEENIRRYSAVAMDNAKQYLKAKNLNHDKLCKLYLGGYDRVEDVKVACRSIMNEIHLYCDNGKSEIPENYRIPDETFIEFYKKDEISSLEDMDMQETVADTIFSIAKIGKVDVDKMVREFIEVYNKSFPDVSLIPGIKKDYIIIHSKYLKRRFCVFVVAKLGSLCSTELLKEVITFLVKQCIKDDEPIPELVDTLGETFILSRKKEDSDTIYDVLNGLNKDKNKTPKEVEIVGVFLGMLAKNIDRSNERFSRIVNELRLLATNPSKSIQIAVSNCFAQIDDLPNANGTMDRLYSQCLKQKDNAIKRGIALAIAGIAKAQGLGFLYRYRFYERFMNKPLDHFTIEKKKRVTSGEDVNINLTALITINAFCEVFEDLFEPYIIDVFPKVRPVVGEKDETLRHTAIETINAMTNSLTHHGIGITVPSLIDGLSSDDRKEREVSCNILGDMAKQTSHQLNDYLPKIIKPLVTLLIDSDYDVSEAAKAALNNLASVIKNPEISSLIPSILESLENPPKYTAKFYQQFEDMEFTHLIDSSSIALIHYILLRGLSNPEQAIRAKSGVLIGSLTNLTDAQDLMPYLEIFLPELKNCITDNDPDVRTTSTLAIGQLISFLGDDKFKGLKEWLLQMINSNKSTVHRLGAAQGLSEYYKAVGVDELREDFDVICNIDNEDVARKESVMFMIYFFCRTMKEVYCDFISSSLMLVVKGLSDTNEVVRDAALKAGSVLVREYGRTHLKELLAVLNGAIYNDNTRVQECGINLIGELLEGMAGNVDSSVELYPILKKKLGLDQIGDCLANLYLVRFDEEHFICQRATLVWKKVIVNSGKALKDLKPYILQIVIEKLCQQEKDRKRASRCIGELMEIFESQIVTELMETLNVHIKSDNYLERLGAMNGYVQMMRRGNCLNEKSIDGNIETFVDLMCDENVEVRGESDILFKTLLEKFGTKALEKILDIILSYIANPEKTKLGSEGFNLIMKKNSDNPLIFDTLTPKLLQTPISYSNLETLVLLCKSSDTFFEKNFGLIIQKCFNSISVKLDDEEYCAKLRKVMSELSLKSQKSKMYQLFADYIASYKPAQTKIQALRVLKLIFENKDEQKTSLDIIISPFVTLMKTEKDELVIKEMWEAFEKLHLFVPVDKYYIYINTLVPMIKDASETKQSYTFPADIQPMFRMLVEALKNAYVETKEQSIKGLIILLNYYAKDNSFTACRDSVIGPLVNIFGKQCEPSHRVKLIKLLLTLFQTADHRGKLTAFVMPITVSIFKVLSDADETVADKLVELFKYLLDYGLKIDILLKEILKGLQSGLNPTKTSIYLKVLIRAVKDITPDSWRKAYDAWSKTKRPPTFPIAAVYQNVYDQCLELVPHGQTYYPLLVSALGTMLKFLPDNENVFKELLQFNGFSFEDNDVEELKKELYNAYIQVCPGKKEAAATALKESN